VYSLGIFLTRFEMFISQLCAKRSEEKLYLINICSSVARLTAGCF